MNEARAEWLEELKSAISARDKRGILEHLFYAYSSGWLSLTSQFPIGVNVFEKEWDTLIVLDACRIDAIREVSPEYKFLKNAEIDSIWSVGSASSEWYAQTFVRDYARELAETALISSNPHAGKALVNQDLPPQYPAPFPDGNWNTVGEDELGYLERTRQHVRPYNDISDTAPKKSTIQSPSYVTDRAIVAGRSDHERLVIHYFQPHGPFVRNLIEKGSSLTEVEDNPYKAGRRGLASDEELWSLYLDNLRLVLDSVEVLLKNLDAEKVAITADHGELGQYGHFEGLPHPALKKVPWIETTARDEGTRHPTEEYTVQKQYDVEEQLADLGYL